MSKYIEFQGKDIEKAIESACKELKLEEGQLNYEIVSHGSSGIFGLVGVRKAKIKVAISEKEGPDISKSDAKLKQRVDSLVDSAFGKPKQENKTLPNDNDKAGATKYGLEIIQTFVDAITEGATVEAELQEDRILFKITGGNTAILIGKRGQTLEAIQYLVDKMLNKRSAKRIRILVDVGCYLESRKENLQKLALKLAEKAKRLGKPMTIGQMNAHDRRIVHIHLKNEEGVRTQSIGEGYYRKLMIFPKRRKRNRRS
jgi:spoIIIJ-associated protein